MPFNPKAEYTTVPTEIGIKEFFSYKSDYVTRPPYQRKAVWSKKKKQSLMDSLLRRYYIPKLVIREVRISENETVNEIIDGQQRITTVQDFFDNLYPLPESLKDLDKHLPGKFYKDLETSIQRFIGKSLKFQADVIKDIDKPHDVEHQLIATQIFWRLQQGESLNYMEVAHAQLSSLTRNFIVKYADDQSFDYKKYEPIDNNPHKKRFFSLLNVDNDRMKHLQYMARFLMIERGGGYAELSDRKIQEFIDGARQDDGIDNLSYETTAEAVSTLKTLNAFYDIFKDDPMLDAASGIKEFSIEYFIISIYLLIRHLHRYYVIDSEAKHLIRDFVYAFHIRWKTYDETIDTDMLSFCNRRQQGERELEARDIILRQSFFEYLKLNDKKFVAKDGKRFFSELERIIIYRKGKGICQKCLLEGKSEIDARVSWSNYHADHVVPNSKGGKTELANSEVLCRKHNLIKGATTT